MGKPTLEERCAALKVRMLAGRRREDQEPEIRITDSNVTRHIRKPSTIAPVRVQPEAPPVQLRDPHPLIKAALSANTDVPDEYGKLQFRFKGQADIRVTWAAVPPHRATLECLTSRLRSGLCRKRDRELSVYPACSEVTELGGGLTSGSRG